MNIIASKNIFKLMFFKLHDGLLGLFEYPAVVILLLLLQPVVVCRHSTLRMALDVHNDLLLCLVYNMEGLLLY